MVMGRTCGLREHLARGSIARGHHVMCGRGQVASGFVLFLSYSAIEMTVDKRNQPEPTGLMKFFYEKGLRPNSCHGNRKRKWPEKTPLSYTRTYQSHLVAVK